MDTKIKSLNLEAVSFKAAMDENLSLSEVDRVEFEYRLFLEAKLRHPSESLAPSRIVDRYWHHHILDTSKYSDDCFSIFGRMLHHFPYSGLMGPTDSAEQAARFRNTQNLLKAIAKGESL